MADKEVTTKLTLQGDSGGMISSMQKAEDKIKSFDGHMANITGTIGTMTGVIGMLVGVGSMGALIKSSIDAADNMSKLSQKVGVNIEQLSGMAYAAELADVSAEQLGKGMGKLAKAMYEAAGDPNSGPAKTFRDLGVSVTDSAGKLRSTDGVMMDVAERIARMDDGARKTALAMEVFGKAGADLIPLLNSGKEGIKEATDEARRFGLVLSAEAGRQAEEFNDNLTRLKKQASGAALAFVKELLPAVNSLVGAMAKGGDMDESFIAKLARNTKEEIRVMQDSYVMYETLAKKSAAWVNTGGALGHMFSKKQYDEYIKEIKRIEQEAKESYEKIAQGYSVKAKDRSNDKPGGGNGGGQPVATNMWTLENDLIYKNIQAYEKLKNKQEEYFYQLGQEMETAADTSTRVFKLMTGQAGELKTKRYDVTPLSGYRLMTDDQYSLPQQAGRTDESREKEAQDEFDHGQRMLGIAAGISQQRLGFLGQEEMALQVHYDVSQQQIVMQAARELENVRLTEEEKQRIRDEASARMIQLDQQTAIQRAQIWWDNSQQYIGYAQNMTTMGIQMLLAESDQKDQIGQKMLGMSVRFITQGLQAYMLGKAKEHFLNAASAVGKTTTDTAAATANLTLLQTQATAWAAYYAAMSLNPIGAATYGASAVAMAAVAGSVVPGAITAAAVTGATSVAAETAMGVAWTAGAVLVGAAGEVGAQTIESQAARDAQNKQKKENWEKEKANLEYQAADAAGLLSQKEKEIYSVNQKYNDLVSQYGQQSEIIAWHNAELSKIQNNIQSGQYANSYNTPNYSFTPPAPITQQLQYTGQNGQTIHVNLNVGELYGTDKQQATRWMEDVFAPSMRDALSRGVAFK